MNYLSGLSMAALTLKKREVLKSISLVTERIHPDHPEEAIMIKQSLLQTLQPICYEMAKREAEMAVLTERPSEGAESPCKGARP